MTSAASQTATQDKRSTVAPALASSSEVAAAAALARARGRLAIDTEFISEGRYRPLLCLTQVAVEDGSGPGGLHTILIDALQQVDVAPLAGLLADPEVEVVLHAGRQDVAILRRAWQVDPVNLFDTQIVAGFAGESAQAGYGNLISSVLGLRVGKTASYTRWDERPLTTEQLSYAAEDVAHLQSLADELRRRLRRSNRLSWALEECRRLEAATDERDPDTAWERLPRTSHLDGRSRAVARRLAAWREQTAADEDRPVGSVIQDAPLVELAKRHPTDLDEVRAIRGIHPSILRRRGAAIIETVTLGLGDPPIPREARHPRSDPGDAPLIALAEALLRARASDAGLAYELIATRADLERIISAARRGEPEPDVRTLTGWRRELVGGDLEDLLSGRTAVAVGPGGKLQLRSS
jgi:ribonuclease D